MTINAGAKGCRIEKACEDELRAEGYITWKAIRAQYQNIDIFGLFDVVGVAPDGSHMRFIQCKSNRCDSKTREAVKSIRMPRACEKWIWIWKDRKHWIKEFYD